MMLETTSDDRWSYHLLKADVDQQNLRYVLALHKSQWDSIILFLLGL